MTAPNFEHVKQLFLTSNDLTISDKKAERAGEELERILPATLWNKLEALEPTSPAFEQTFREWCSKPLSAEPADAAGIVTTRVDTDEEPDEYIQDSEFPDYATNWDGTVISLGGPRKKKGRRLRPCPDWAKTSSGKWYPTCYFTLTQNGRSSRQTPAQMLIRRRNTLRSRNQSSYSRKSGVSHSSLP